MAPTIIIGNIKDLPEINQPFETGVAFKVKYTKDFLQEQKLIEAYKDHLASDRRMADQKFQESIIFHKPRSCYSWIILKYCFSLTPLFDKLRASN